MSQLSIAIAAANEDATHAKYLQDPVHGIISMSPLISQCIDTPQFQRLRDLKQLGMTYYIFPGATHNRFEHSIGVAHLAKTWMEILKAKQPEIDINARDIELVTLAGLCHDLGHGPYSHVFDGKFMPRVRPEHKWSHENWSEMMLDYLVNDNGIDIDTDDLKFVKSLIQGKKPLDTSQQEKRFLYDIVSNERNSIDVDKWDYLARDCLNVGMKTNYDCTRLLNWSRVIDDEICFADKEAFNIYEMLHTRYSMFKRVYTHRVGQAMEHMVVDVLTHADEAMGISASVDDPAQFMNMTDCLLRDIERSTSDNLASARDLTRRIRTRQLYRLVDEYPIEQNVRHSLQRSQVTPEKIASFSSSGELDAKDIIVDWSCIHFGLSDGSNPLAHTRFFSRWDPSEAYHIDPMRVSHLLPNQFREDFVRIYVRDADLMYDAQNAFRRFKKAVLPTTSSSQIDNQGLTMPSRDASPRKGTLSTLGMESPSHRKRRRIQFEEGPSTSALNAASPAPSDAQYSDLEL